MKNIGCNGFKFRSTAYRSWNLGHLQRHRACHAQMPSSLQIMNIAPPPVPCEFLARPWQSFPWLLRAIKNTELIIEQSLEELTQKQVKICFISLTELQIVKFGHSIDRSICVFEQCQGWYFLQSLISSNGLAKIIRNHPCSSA